MRDAAPEMLAALEVIASTLPGPDMENDLWRCSRFVRETAKAAIAKAKGDGPKTIPVALAAEVEVSVKDERTGKRRVTTWGQWKADLDGGAALVPEDVEGIVRDLLDRGESAFMDQVEGDGILWRMRLVSGGAR